MSKSFWPRLVDSWGHLRTFPAQIQYQQSLNCAAQDHHCTLSSPINDHGSSALEIDKTCETRATGHDQPWFIRAKNTLQWYSSSFSVLIGSKKLRRLKLFEDVSGSYFKPWKRRQTSDKERSTKLLKHYYSGWSIQEWHCDYISKQRWKTGFHDTLVVSHNT